MPTASARVERHAPEHVVTGRAGVGLVSAIPWRVQVPPGEQTHTVRLPELQGRRIGAGQQLIWALLPQGLPDELSDVTALDELDDLWAGTAVSLDLVADDGSRLSATGAVDQYGVRLDPVAQADARMMWVDQWNLRRVDLDGWDGRSIAQVELVVRACPGRVVTVFVDGVALAAVPEIGAEPVEQVRTTRGSHSAPAFSRGNTAPLVGVPHGRLYAVPVTDAAAPDWVYRWHGEGPADDPRPRLQAIATSHLPSPWIRERGAFQVMPADGLHPELGRSERGLAFDHDHEMDRPHVWSARLDGGLVVEAAAGDSVMGVRCSFPSGDGSFVLDHRGTVTDVRIELDEAGLTVSCLLDDTPGAPPQHVHVRVPAATAHTLTVASGQMRGAVQVAGSGSAEVLVGLSSIDAATAAAHVAAAPGVDALIATARDRWNALLAIVEAPDATPDDLVLLRSSLYRLFLFPTRHDEQTPQGRRWRSPYEVPDIRSIRAPELGPRPALGAGSYAATNGFWDTYRTAWPLLGLLTPDSAGDLADGFLAHFRDTGWVPRWSAPAPVDCMTGTTSDTVLADLLVKDVPGIDLQDAWQSVLAHAGVPAPDRRVGRKGLHQGLFRRYVSTEVHEGMSWTLDAALNDWAGSQLGRLVAATLPEGAERRRVEAETEWLARRSLLYQEVFQAGSGFFVGRDADGGWRRGPDELDPDEWGHDYTETNAWGTAVTVPHDGAGLVALHGGEAGLSAMLDAIVARPETGAARHAGSYGRPIHEMTEARDCRTGMVALSNQPAHHIPFMYMHVGRHDDAHALVADALDRLFVGTDLGQGFAGDEDNGEMSAWWVFASVGLYPLVPASGSWVLLPPRLPHVVIRPPGRAPITIRVTNPSRERRFIASVRVDGRPWEQVSIPDELLRGGTTLEFTLAEEPTGWAAGSRPPSARELHGHTEPLRDLTEGAPCSHAAVIDDVAGTPVPLAAGETVEVRLPEPRRCGSLMTVTADVPGRMSWSLLAEVDGDWVVADARVAEEFTRTQQTRVFRIEPPSAPVTAFRWVADEAVVLRQLEVFAP
ncbi:GH92 family glycosyl hydrolase [Pseudactinotalea suaedae]|uniref:GH92 family glycosyl hydrolase n=1 Tax=Pseudactinotalea suaedae TaxID=1524924 RepID=UPI0012E16A9B|nr:GH92 family glycosyl hydrolase [Pseudactinotalea suaedae]